MNQRHGMGRLRAVGEGSVVTYSLAGMSHGMRARVVRLKSERNVLVVEKP